MIYRLKSSVCQAYRFTRMRKIPWRVCVALLCAASLFAQARPTSELLSRARNLVIAGKPEQAVPIYQELVQEFPNNAVLRVDLSIAQYQARHYSDSAQTAKAALRLQPGLPSANLFLGASYLQLGQYASAIPPLQKALEAQPADRNARLNLAEAYSEARQYQQAAQQFQKLSEILPDSPRVWYGLGHCYEKLSRQSPEESAHYRELAQQAYKRLDQLPASPESRIHAAELLDRSSEWMEAAKQWRKALELAPHDNRARGGLAWALFRARDYKAALDVIESMRKDGFDSAVVDFLTGGCWLNLERPERSIPYLEKALAADPHFLPAKAALGQVLLQTDKVREAIPFLRAALSVDEDGTTHFQLYRAYSRTGQMDAAKRALADYEEFKKRLPQASPVHGNAYR
ncbi:MAG TPA: tetratricopeptide repeat protein [Terriglobia bacterium]|nr:tetratricopeptide repeat protein [Terriglobia bacterium]